MPSIKPTRFIVNTDMPLPERTDITKATLTFPAGSSYVPTGFSKEISVPIRPDSTILRVAFQCNRTGDRMFASGQTFLGLDFNDGRFNVYVGVTRAGLLYCGAYLYSGLDATKNELESDVTFTYYISGYKMP